MGYIVISGRGNYWSYIMKLWKTKNVEPTPIGKKMISIQGILGKKGKLEIPIDEEENVFFTTPSW